MKVKGRLSYNDMKVFGWIFLTPFKLIFILFNASFIIELFISVSFNSFGLFIDSNKCTNSSMSIIPSYFSDAFLQIISISLSDKFVCNFDLIKNLNCFSVK